ncbi:MAG: thioredoxin family protein [Candidatus Coproplasma sp.]
MTKFNLIEISGDSCAGCHALLPALNAVAQSEDMQLVRIDLERDPQAAERYNVVKIPTVIIADGETEVARCSGYQPEEILQLWVQAKTQEYLKRKNN